MKRIKLLILVMTLSSCYFSTESSLFGQSLPDSSSNWTIAYIRWGNYYQNDTYQIQQDTLINGVQYKSIYVTHDSLFYPSQSEYYCAVREYENQWYFIPESDTAEYFLYDFSADVGDTITINNPYADGIHELYVFDKDSIDLISGRREYLDVGIYDGPSGNASTIDRWIKGIGSVNGLFYSGWYIFDGGYQLLCFHEEKKLIYLNSPDGSCGYILVGSDKRSESEQANIFPNPIDTRLFVESKSDISVEIIDLHGRSFVTKQSNVIDMTGIPSGIYILRIYTLHRTLLYTEKIIKR